MIRPLVNTAQMYNQLALVGKGELKMCKHTKCGKRGKSMERFPARKSMTEHVGISMFGLV